MKDQFDIGQALEKLRPAIEEIEGLRNASRQKRKLGKLLYYGSMLITFLIGALISSLMGNPLGFVIALPIFIVFGWMAHARFIANPGFEFLREYKERFVKRLVPLFVDGVIYHPNQGISRSVFESSGLYPPDADLYDSEDLFEGKVDATAVQFSEIHTQRKRTRSGDSGNTVYYETEFEGIFFIADFHKEFQKALSVMPDLAERNFGWVGSKLQKFGGNLLKMENPEFENRFVVRGEDAVEAHYLLTPDMQERILNLGKRLGREMRMSFRDSKVFLAFPKQGNWFDPDPDQPVGDRDATIRLLSEIKSCLTIVDELDLNTRVWSKD